MSMNRKQVVVVAGAVAVAVAVFSAAIAASGILPSATLDRLENSVDPNRALVEGIQPNRMAKLVELSREFAKAVAGNDTPEYVAAFAVALNTAVAADEGTLVVGQFGRRTFNPSGELTIVNWLGDDRFVANARLTITDQGRIVGGRPAGPKEFPDCVAVGGPNSWCCTGTLVAPNVVITAGHCVGPCSARVFVGQDVDKPNSGKTVEVMKVVRHPEYGKNQHNDLAVLILKEDIAGVEPRAIAPSDEIDNAYSVRVVGFGTTDFYGRRGYGIKRLVDVPVASSKCEYVPGSDEKYGCDKGLELVAGSPFLNRDSCSGDSGGPCYVVIGGKWFLAGATSRAAGNSTRPCGDGGIYVRVDKYWAWVKSVPGGHWGNN